MNEITKIRSKHFPDVVLKIIPGHFVTPNSHINYYIDMTTMKARQSEAKAAARALAAEYVNSTIVDTIVCLDGTQVIGAYLADELTVAGIQSMNSHKTIYVATPEYDTQGQMIFRDNIRMMIEGKHVLILLASATTGNTLSRAVRGVQYYGGNVSGISAIFSAAYKVENIPVNYLFSMSDIPDYASYTPDNCPMCRNSQKIDALCNGFGFSEL
ncbi:MAG: phosphoribosyltransferase [Butyrivibrio sp.]|nr:phosphoribosyltransferase [Butyrivibrio sp.]